MFLDRDTFTAVIASSPLVSIDLVVENEVGEILLGQRLNRPARGFWFVPGGRILKNESIEIAFSRLTKEELGKAFTIKKAKLCGPYDHFYDDFVFGDSVTTHYVALAYTLVVEAGELDLPFRQHGQYKWFTRNELKSSDLVHAYSKLYIT